MNNNEQPQTGGYIRAYILGEDRGLKFGNLAAENIMVKLTQLGIATGGANYSGAMISTIIYWGLFCNCIAKEETPDFSFEDVMDWVDDVTDEPTPETAELLTRIVRTYEDSKAAKSVMTKLEKAVEEIKKKTAHIQAQTSALEKDGNTSGGSPSES